MSINRLVSSTILLIALIMAAMGGYVTMTKVAVMRDLATADLRLDVIRALGNIPRYLSPERGLATVLEQTMVPGDQKGLASLVEFRQPTDTAMAAAMTRVSAIHGQLDDGQELEAAMADVSQRFKQYRRMIDETLLLPVAERGNALQVTIDQTDAMNAIFTRVLRDELHRMATDGNEAYRNIGLADLVWSLRDVAGREQQQLMKLLIAKKPVTAEQGREHADLGGRIQQIGSSLLPLLDDPTTPADIKSALATVKATYFEQRLEEVRKIEAAFDTGDFPVSPTSWRDKNLLIWPKVFTLRDAFYDLAAQEIGEARASTRLSAILAGMALLTALLLAGGVLVLVKRRVTSPITAMTGAMRQLAQGELGTQVPGVGRTDEIGEMANAVLVFRDAAVAKLDRDREIEAERRRGEEQRRAGEAETLDRERSLVTSSIGTGLANLAAQDLTYRMLDDVPEAYRRLQADFNTAMQQLEQAIEGVAETAHAIEADTRQITTAADELSQRTAHQAASLEETAAALEEITVTVGKTADGAKHANDMVGIAKTDAEKGSEVVREAIEAMSGIEKSSRQISQIIGVIDEIAFQTNLLALNAGVEAARAGDAGRGFAVVASEVRALAQRSAEAAKEIKSLISASSSQVDRGVNLVAESGKALGRIVGQITEVAMVVSEIAAGAKEQATGLKDVNTSVSHMDSVTQLNAAMVEETTAASHKLQQETDELIGSVSRFNVSSAMASKTPQAAARRPAQGASRPARKTAGLRA